MKTLKESILGGMNSIEVDTEPWLIIKGFFNKKRSKTPIEKDMFGKPLSIRDMVIAVHQGRPMLGIIVEVARGCVAICFDGNLDKLKKSADGSYITPVGCYDVMKIELDIAKQLLP